MRIGLIALLILGLWTHAQAQPKADPDWPCVQRLVPELTAGQMWSGPPLDEIEGFWQADSDIAPMVLDLADTGLEYGQIETGVARFADGLAEDEKSVRLPLLFKAVLETVNGERHRAIALIRKYATKQRALADRIAEANARLRGIRLDQELDEEQAGLRAIKEERDWDLRVFDDRQSMLPLICEQPVLLEQRAFALARSIQGLLP